MSKSSLNQNSELIDQLLQYPPEILDRAVHSFNMPDLSTYTSIEEIQNIPVYHVIAENWDSGRLKGVQNALNQGILLDPIRVCGYRFPNGLTLYSLEDGNHRTIAQRLRGEDYIRAKVGGITYVNPEKSYFINTGQELYLFHDYTWESFYGADIDPLSPQQAEILRLLGVNREINVPAIVQTLTDWELYTFNRSWFTKGDPRFHHAYKKLHKLFVPINDTEMASIVHYTYNELCRERERHSKNFAITFFRWLHR